MRRAHVLGRDHGRVRDAAGRRLDRGDPAAVRGVAQRAADVVAEPERAHARGERAPPRRRSSRPRSRPGPTGCASARAARSRCGCAGRGRAGSCGRSGSRPRRAGARPAARRSARSPRPARGRRRSSRVPGDVDVLLDRERDAVQRAAAVRRARRPRPPPRAPRRPARRTTALRCALTASMRSRWASTTSREETSRARDQLRPAHRRRGATAPRTTPLLLATRECLP